MTAAIAFCNDIDFANWAAYREVHRVLEGEFGIYSQDSFWLFDPSGSDMALFKGSITEKGPQHDKLLEEINNGHMAILHSAGNFSFSNTTIRSSRYLVSEGLGYLKKNAAIPIIWTNHGDEGDIQNIGGRYCTYHEGDLPSSNCYILDLLNQYGIQFFCTDINLVNTFVFSPWGGRLPSLLENVTTRSGHIITTFNRYRGALPKAPDAQSLGLQLSEDNLQSLIEADGYTVIYQHWCVHRDEAGKPFTARSPVFPQETMKSLHRLIRLQEEERLRILKLTDLLQECYHKERADE